MSAVEDAIVDLIDTYDGLDGAIDRIVTAQPSQMTDAAFRLETERRRFRKQLQDFAMKAFPTPSKEAGS